MMRRLFLMAVTGALIAALTATAAMAQQEEDCPEGQVAVSLVGGGPLECVDEDVPDQERTFEDVEVTPAADGGANVFATFRGDLLIGTQDGDRLVGGFGDDRLEGQGGDDWLDGGAGHDLVLGQAGNDLVDGGTGNDHVRGGAGNDYVTGYIGNDALHGNAGDDFIYAADGWFDRVLGDEGYDVCVVDWFDRVDLCEEVYIQ